MAETRHPLLAAVDACAALKFAPLPAVSTAGLRAGVVEEPEYWHRADLLATEGALGPVFDKLVDAHGPGHRLPAVVHFQRALLRDPIFLVASSIYLTGRAPLLEREHLWFPWHADASLGTPLLTRARTAVLPEDDCAGHPDAVVAADRQDRDRMAAEHLVAAFAPLLGAVHDHTRMGIRTLWGWVVDSLHFYMLNPARFLGRDAGEAWAQAQGLADEVAKAGAVFRARPQLFPFCPDHPRGTWGVRGTCCFDYKADAEHGYCLTCPLRDDGSRLHKLQEWLRDPASAP